MEEPEDPLFFLWKHDDKLIFPFEASQISWPCKAMLRAMRQWLFFYGVGYGIILAFTGMVYFLYVVELFPVEIRNVGVGMSYNIGFCIFGGFAPLICEASHDVASWAPGCVLLLAGVITASTVLWSLRLQSRGVLCLAHIRVDPYFETSCKCRVPCHLGLAACIADPKLHGTLQKSP